MAGDALMGRVFDALGNPIDNLPDPLLSDSWPLMGKKLNPLSRAAIDKPMDVGVRAINSLLLLGVVSGLVLLLVQVSVNLFYWA